MAVSPLDPTVAIASATLALIGAVLLLYGIGGKAGWTPIAWGVANIAHGIGWLLTVLPGYAMRPDLLILANLCFAVAMGMFWSATAHFTKVKRSPLLLTVPALITLLTFPVFTYIMPSLPLRIIIISVLVAVTCYDSGRMLTSDPHKPTRLLGYALIGIGLLHVTRGLLALAAIWNPTPLAPLIHVPRISAASLLTFTIWTVGMLVSSAHRSEKALHELLIGLKKTSLTDPLTELPNRRFMQQQLEEAQRRLDGSGEIFSILILDIDNFKAINDSHGHEAGDHALRWIARALPTMVNNNYILARWGGDEFVMLLPNTNAIAAQQVAQWLRETLSQQWVHYHDASFHITVTMGGATGSVNQTLMELMRRADHALYQGKRIGRDQVRWA